MISTAQEYKEFVNQLRGDLVEIGDNLPQKEKRSLMLKTAIELGLSFMTVSNYLSGQGTNPETSLLIKEKIKELIGQ